MSEPPRPAPCARGHQLICLEWAKVFSSGCNRLPVRVDLGSEADIPEGRAKCVTGNRSPYALFKVGGKVYCLDNTCAHVGGPLCQGKLDQFVVQCPWHGSRFDIRTGQVVGPPARKPVRSYPVSVEGGRVWAELP